MDEYSEAVNKELNGAKENKDTLTGQKALDYLVNTFK